MLPRLVHERIKLVFEEVLLGQGFSPYHAYMLEKLAQIAEKSKEQLYVKGNATVTIRAFPLSKYTLHTDSVEAEALMNVAEDLVFIHNDSGRDKGSRIEPDSFMTPSGLSDLRATLAQDKKVFSLVYRGETAYGGETVFYNSEGRVLACISSDNQHGYLNHRMVGKFPAGALADLTPQAIEKWRKDVVLGKGEDRVFKPKTNSDTSQGR